MRLLIGKTDISRVRELYGYPPYDGLNIELWDCDCFLAGWDWPEAVINEIKTNKQFIYRLIDCAYEHGEQEGARRLKDRFKELML